MVVEATTFAASGVSLQGELVHRRFRPLYANAAFAHLCDCCTPDEILAQADVLPFFDDETRAAPEAAWLRLLRQPATYGRRTFRRRSGEDYVAEIYARVIVWEGEPAVAMAMIDLSELDGARHALKHAHAAEHAKQALAASARLAVHAPLKDALGGLRALAGADLAPEAARMARDTLGACEALCGHIDKVLYVTGCPLPVSLDVLVVDDNPATRTVLRAALVSLSCRAVMAESGAAALALLAQRRFDVVLMDLMMPDMDGFKVARRIRGQTQPWSQIPIAALTASSAPGIRERIADAGMDAFLRKPVDIVHLAETLALLASALVQAPEGDEIQYEDQADKAGDQFQREHDPGSPGREAGQPTRDWTI